MTCPPQPSGGKPAGRAPVAPELPTTLYIETTNRCDSLCRTCIRTFQTLEPPRDLTLDELVRIVDQFPRLDRVVLHGIGEPLLNPALGDMIAHLKGRGALVVFNSDAIGLSERRRHALILAGLDELRVSLDAATPETYLAIRGVPAFHRVVENVAALVALRRELDLATPAVSLWFTALKHNVRELPDFVRLAAKVGASSVHVQRLVTNGQGLATREESLHGALSVLETEMLAQATRSAEELGLCLQASGNTTPEASLTPEASRRPWSGCQRPWSLSYITANGNVLPCCISPWTARDYAGLILGNAFTQSFGEIWSGERYREFRTRFESEQPPEACRGCGRLWSL